MGCVLGHSSVETTRLYFIAAGAEPCPDSRGAAFGVIGQNSDFARLPMHWRIQNPGRFGASSWIQKSDREKRVKRRAGKHGFR